MMDDKTLALGVLLILGIACLIAAPTEGLQIADKIVVAVAGFVTGRLSR